MYFVRAVNLVLMLEKTVKRPQVESIIAQSLTSAQADMIQEVYEAFGVFWRLIGMFYTFFDESFLEVGRKTTTCSPVFDSRYPL